MREGSKCLALCMFCMITLPVFSQVSYLELNLNSANTAEFFAAPRRPLEVFRVIQRAAADNRIHGIILNISNFSASREFLWELRNELEKFKTAQTQNGSNKRIVAFISNADIDLYKLASVADKIVMDELGILTMLGYSVTRGYVQRTLEKLGVGVREMNHFEYKSAAETFTRISMSDADRRQYNDFLDDIFNSTRDTLKVARNWTSEQFYDIINRNFLFSARGALNYGLVDITGRKDAVMEVIKELEGKEVKNFFLYGDRMSSITGIHPNYSAPTAGGLFRRPPAVAVVYASGQTDMSRGMNALALSQTIRELANRSRVKAIVIRIDSPGGSAEAADHFAEAVRYAREKKPVVVSMGGVAASGGYWAAMNATHIMATPYTVTGSIGVIASWFYDSGLNSRLGITTDTLQRGNSADLFSGVLLPNRSLTPAEEERYRALIMDIYSIFIKRVAAGRNMEIEKVEAAAQGRIFSGTRALEYGLIDSIGGLPDAIRVAKKLAEIPEGKTVRFDEFPRQRFFDRFMSNMPFLRLFRRNRSSINSFNIVTDFLLPVLPASLAGRSFHEDLSFRLERNGQVMPILPLRHGL